MIRISTSMRTSSEGLSAWFLLLPLLFVIVGAVILFFGVRQIQNAQASETWPSVEGVVTVSELGRQTGSSSRTGTGTRRRESTTYSADISYDYAVGGVEYVNGTVRFGQVNTSSPSDARAMLKKYPVGAPVTVYYNPENPQIAVLEPGVGVATWFLPGFGALFLVVGLGVAAGMFVMLRK